MSDDFRVTGADDFLALSKALKQAGRTELRKELNKGLREGAKPLIPLTRAAARSMLPKTGGLSELVARAPQRVQTKTGRDPSVRLVAGKKGSGARASDDGAVRHPRFGHPGAFYVTKTPAGWFTKTVEDHVHEVLPALEQAIQNVVDKVVRDG